MNQNLNTYSFYNRHIGIDSASLKKMLDFLGYDSLSSFIENIVPTSILNKDLDKKITLTNSFSTEEQCCDYIEQFLSKNKIFKSFIGKGFTNSYLPAVIRRMVLENPDWYSSYTPYQAEISQGRLLALFLFQTMISELTGLDVANASLLDEGTSATEAMILCYNHYKETQRSREKDKTNELKFFISNTVYDHIKATIKTKARLKSIGIIEGNESSINPDEVFGVILQNPSKNGSIKDYSSFISQLKEKNPNILVVINSDLLSTCLIKSPKDMGADIAVGSCIQLGSGLNLGGPSAAFFAVREDLIRKIPGRIIGESVDSLGNKRYRLALQTREQHIRREKASSNICTAQVLMANISLFYLMYHGKKGILDICRRINNLSYILYEELKRSKFKILSDIFFDTVIVTLDKSEDKVFKEIIEKTKLKEINFRTEQNSNNYYIGLTFDETSTLDDLVNILYCFNINTDLNTLESKYTTIASKGTNSSIPDSLKRKSSFLEDKVFNEYCTELKFSRFLKRLVTKDFSLINSMIPLGSCTMKLNPSFSLYQLTNKYIRNVHPFAPCDQYKGFTQLLKELNDDLCATLGFDKFIFQPLSGATGESTGLTIVRSYLKDKGMLNRTVCLIPESAHGTNPASAATTGFTVVVVKCDKQGNLSLQDLKDKLEKYSDSVGVMMITYPSTHGVFEEQIVDICKLVHSYGAVVYMDGANFNAQLGLASPGLYGADVCHLNLHKSFGLPHGGGGPGVGPVGVKSFLIPYLPNHPEVDALNYDVNYEGNSRLNVYSNTTECVSSSPWGNSLLLTIAWLYINALGIEGMKKASEYAILNANYISARLRPYYNTLYTGKNGLVAHECILDMREFKKEFGIDVDDVAKRLMDYGFHAPTMSFPVHSTLMVEPTESEDIGEIDRFCDSLIAIKKEMEEIKEGIYPKDNNVLKNAPHSMDNLKNWDKPYSIEKGCFPKEAIVDEVKYWPYSSRIDNTFGDRNIKVRL